MTLIIICLVIGLLPAAIAQSKGKNFIVWWLYGALLFIVALPHALIMRPDRAALEERDIENQVGRKCPHCAEVIKREAKVCRFCGRDVEPAAPPVVETY
jgi:type VI protein secretion system component VasK